MRSEDLEPRRNEFLAMVVNEIRTPTVALSESLVTLGDDWARRRRSIGGGVRPSRSSAALRVANATAAASSSRSHRRR